LDSRLPRLALAISIALSALAFVAPAHATFMGESGKLAFIRYHPDENADLWTVNAAGSGLTRLTDNEVFGGDSAYDTGPSWSPDGRKILFGRHRPIEDASGIFTINPDGSGLTRLDEYMDSFAWLRDGRVAFTKWGPEAGLYTVRADGTGKTRVGPNPDGGGLSWSPDGTRFVYTGWSLDGYSAWVSNMDGTNVRQILQLPRYESPSPTWAPGPRIAFMRHAAAGGWDIYTINPDGTGELRLTDDSATDLNQTWSPDGRRLVFLSDRDSEPGDVFDVFTIAADGTDMRNLTAASTASDTSAVWSPDNRLVAFTGHEEGRSGLFTVDAGGNGRSRVTTTPVDEHDDMLSWQPLTRSSFGNAASFCRAHREAIGRTRFAGRYGQRPKGAGAFGRCVRGTG
jgi:Tol biopolymer transport system component